MRRVNISLKYSSFEIQRLDWRRHDKKCSRFPFQKMLAAHSRAHVCGTAPYILKTIAFLCVIAIVCAWIQYRYRFFSNKRLFTGLLILNLTISIIWVDTCFDSFGITFKTRSFQLKKWWAHKTSRFCCCTNNTNLFMLPTID